LSHIKDMILMMLPWSLSKASA